jgi:DNA-binding transcriptional ArsR family regulator
VRIEVDPLAMDRLRVGFSPLWETVASLKLLARHGELAPWPYSSWARTALAVADADLVAWFRDCPGLGPSHLLTPPSGWPCPEIADELAALRAMPPDELTDGPPSPGGPDPAGTRRWLCDELARYWSAAMAPYWARMRTALEEDMLLRARVMATAGTETLLSQLPGRLAWRPPALQVAGVAGPDVAVRGGRLTLVPLIFARSVGLVVADRDGVAVSYQSKGAALLAEPAHPRGGPANGPAPGDRLSILVGRGRANVLRALATPTGTTALAESLDMAASTVSQHLTTLVAAGVVHRRRVGGRVLYELNRAGAALLQYLDAAY